MCPSPFILHFIGEKQRVPVFQYSFSVIITKIDFLHRWVRWGERSLVKRIKKRSTERAYFYFILYVYPVSKDLMPCFFFCKFFCTHVCHIKTETTHIGTQYTFILQPEFLYTTATQTQCPRNVEWRRESWKVGIIAFGCWVKSFG